MTKFREKMIVRVSLASFVGAMCLASAAATTPNAGRETKPAPISRPDDVPRICVAPQYTACREAGGSHGQCKHLCTHEH